MSSDVILKVSPLEKHPQAKLTAVVNNQVDNGHLALLSAIILFQDK